MKGQHSGVGHRHGAALAGLLFAAAVLVAGCATTDNTAETAEVDPVAMCRAAIADVSRFCAGEEADPDGCEEAKTRSADFCLED